MVPGQVAAIGPTLALVIAQAPVLDLPLLGFLPGDFSLGPVDHVRDLCAPVAGNYMHFDDTHVVQIPWDP